jgi:hypothetical protein
VYVESCLEPFPDGAFHGQAGPASGPRPTLQVVTFEALADMAPVLAVDGWTAHSALVDHHPIAPAVGYRIERGPTSVAVSGDTAVCDGVRQLASRVDVLVHEALLTSAVRPSLLDWNAGAGAVGALAAEVAVGTLVLTHLLPAPESAPDDEAFLARPTSPVTSCAFAWADGIRPDEVGLLRIHPVAVVSHFVGHGPRLTVGTARPWSARRDPAGRRT